jgi:D-serine deaminase-like pyridoxal phosphate-dependent protein
LAGDSKVDGAYACVFGTDLVVDRINEEHGMIRRKNGGETGLKVGDILRLTPAHICPVINLQNYIIINENDDYRKSAVDARGY